MITLSLIIAYLLRNKFVPKNAARADKIIYYVCCVGLTPIFGPLFFKILIESPIENRKPGESRTMADFNSINNIVGSL